MQAVDPEPEERTGTRRPSTLLLAIGGVIIAVAVIVAVAGCAGAGNGTASPSAVSSPAGQGGPSSAPATIVWPAPPDPMERTVAAGLVPEPKEYLTNHVHAHLDIFIDGNPVLVPSGIGINTSDPDVRRFDEPDGTVAYGGIELCSTPCISPLHTHDPTGIIHTESATPEPNTLGQFFTEWGLELSRTCVGEFCGPKPISFYVNGTLYSGDPGAIELTDRKEIAIVIGTPPAVIPATADFSRA